MENEIIIKLKNLVYLAVCEGMHTYTSTTSVQTGHKNHRLAAQEDLIQILSALLLRERYFNNIAEENNSLKTFN